MTKNESFERETKKKKKRKKKKRFIVYYTVCCLKDPQLLEYNMGLKFLIYMTERIEVLTSSKIELKYVKIPPINL